MDDKLKQFYDALVSNGNKLPDYETFSSGMADPNIARRFHESLVNNGNKLPDFDTFYSTLNPGKDQASVTPIGQQESIEKQSSWTDSPRNFLATINQTVYNIPSDIADAWAIASAFTERQLAKIGVPGADANIGAEDIGLGSIKYKKISDEYRDMVENIAPVDEEFKSTFAGGVAQGLGQVTGMMLTGGGSRASQILKATNLSGTSVTPIVNAGKELLKNMTSRQGLIGGSMNASANYRQAKEEGATEEQALQYGIENLVVGSIMENLPIQSMFSRIAKMEPGAKILDVVKEGLVGASEEAVTEAMQTTYENMSAQRIYDVNKEMLDGVGDAAAVGGTVGFLLNATMSALTGKRARVKSKEEQEIIDQAINETREKIDAVENNNRSVEETVSTLENSKFRTINDGSQDLQFIEMPDGSVEYTEDGMTEPTAIAMTGLLNMRYPNFEFSVQNNTGKNPLSPTDFTVVGRPKQQEQVVDNKTEEQQPVAEQKPTISDMAGESVTVRIGNRNVSGIVEVDEGGKATITEGNRVYEIPADAEFSEFVRPVSISPEGDFVVNGDSFSEARIVFENGEKKALLVREDGTTKAVTNPRVVEEIEYNISLAAVDQMTDQEADNLYTTYEQQRQTQRATETGADQTVAESEEDRKLREATEEIDLIEELALMELQDVESQAKLVEFTPKTKKSPSTYLVKKNADGTYSATLNGRKVSRPEIVSELGKLFEQQTGVEISKLQEQTNKLKQEVEQKLFGRGGQTQQQATEGQVGTGQVATENVQQQPVDQGVDTKVQVKEQKTLPEKTAEKLTEDGSGNYVFHHYSAERRPFIKRSDGTGSRATSREEQRSLSAVGGMAMYYPQEGQVEGMIQAKAQHTVLVPKDKVYDADADPLGFEKEARERFEKVRPGQSFDDNYRVAFITQVAGDNGFDMVVAKWKGEELRAQTTKELVPIEGNIPMKPIPVETFSVGDKIKYNSGTFTITSVDGNVLGIEGVNMYGDPVKGGINLNFERRRVQKIESAPKTKDQTKKGEPLKAIAAPFYNTKVKGTKDASELRKTKEYKAHIKMINDIAKAFGITINQTEDTIGGYVNDSGEEIVELSTVITVADDTDLDSLEEMAAVLASLAPEVQESTIAAKYVDESDPGFQGDSGLIEYVIEVGDSQAALDALDRAGIRNFTVNETAGTVTLLDFSKGTDAGFNEMIAKFVDELDSKGISYGKQSKTAAESRFIDVNSRSTILERIRRNAVQKGGQEAGGLYNVITEAISRDNEFRKEKGYPLVGEQSIAVSDEASVNEFLSKTRPGDTKSKIIEVARKALNTLKSIFPQMDIHLHLTNESFEAVTGRIAAGTFTYASADGKVVSGRIDINLEKASIRTVFHEVAHAAMLHTFGENPAKFKVFRKKITDILGSSNVAQLNQFADQYAENDSHEEFLVELTAMLAQNRTNLTTKVISAISDLVNQIVSSITNGKFKPFSSDPTAAELLDFFNILGESIKEGRDISDIKSVASEVKKSNTKAQSVSIMKGAETMMKYGLSKGDNLTRKIGEALEARQRNKYGTINRGDYSKEASAKISSWMVSEIKYFLEVAGEASGRGWYGEKYQKAIDGMAKIFPELKSDQDSRDIFTMLVAITSDGQKVLTNFKLASIAYDFYKKNGRFPDSLPGLRVDSFEANLARLNNMISEYNGDIKKMKSDLLSVSTISEINKKRKAEGLGPLKTSWPVDFKAPFSASVFGPKLGMFYANLSGDESYPTLDRWWSRMFNRYRGTLIPEVKNGYTVTKSGEMKAVGLQALKNALGDPMMSDDQALIEAKRHRDSYANKKYKKGTDIEKMANTIYKSAFENINDAPFNKSDRKFMYDTVLEAKRKLKRSGVDLSVADIQAVLWYYEKNLYKTLGVRGNVLGISYQEAAETTFKKWKSAGETFNYNFSETEDFDNIEDVDDESDVDSKPKKTKVAQQKEKVAAIAKDLKDQVNKPNMGIAVDFRAQAESDARFYKTLKNLVVEYARLKGLQFSEFIQDVERLFNSKMSKENRQYLSELWKEVKSETPKRNVMTENKGLTEREKNIQGLEEILAAKAREFTQKLNRQMAKASEAIGAQKAKLQAEKDRVEAIRSEIRQFINDNRVDINKVGARLNAAILKKVNDAKTEMSMKKAIEYMEKVLTDQKFRNFLMEKESLIEKIKSESDPKKQVKRESGVIKSKKKQTADGIFVLKKIYEAIGMTSQEADARKQQLEQELFNPAGMDPDELFMKQAELYSLKFSGLDQYMNLDVIKGMLEEIRDIKRTDKLNVLQDIMERRKKIEEGVSEALESINPNGKEIKPRYLTKESDFRPSSKLRAFVLSNNNWRTLMDKLSRFHKSDPHQSPLSKRMNSLAFEMSQAENEAKRKVLKDIQDNFERIFKTNKKDKFYVAQENTIKKPFTYTDINGNTIEIEMSQNEAYKRWMELQDESLLPTFEKMGFGTEYVNALEAFMTPEVKAWAEWQLKEFYPKYGKSINKVYRKMFGVDMQLAENYSPVFRERKDIKDSPDALIASQSVMNTVSNSSLKSRTANTIPIAYMDGDRVLVNYVQQMEFFKNYAEGLSEMSSIMKDPRVLETIEQIHGREYVDQIRVFIDDFYRTSDKYKPFEALLKKFRQNFTVASLALNPVTFIKQLTSIPAYMSFMPAGKWMADVSFWSNPIKNAKFLYENSRYLQNRYEVGFDRDVVSAMMADHKRSITGGKSFADRMMVLTKYGDGGAILIGGWPVYNHYYKEGKKSGMSESDAVKYGIAKFEEATDLAQQATDVKDFNTFQRGSEFYKVMTMYKTSPIQYHTLAMESLRNMAYGRGSVAQNMKQFLLFHSVLPMIFQWASMGFRFPDEEEEYYDLIQAGIIGNINAMFIVGDMLVYLKQAVIEGKPFDYTTNIVIDGLYGESEKALKKLTKLLDDDADLKDVASAIHNVANVASTMVPQMAPYRQVARTTEGIYDIIQSDTEYPVKRALGWSSWALGENPMANRQKNVLLEAMYGKDYKKKVKEQEETKPIIL